MADPVSVVCDPQNSGRLLVRAPFALVDVCRELPGRRWETELRLWSIPATPQAAASLQDAFGEWRGGLTTDEATERLLAAAARRDGHAEPVAELELPGGGAYPHQRVAFARFSQVASAGLAFGMGGGKSRVAIALAQEWGCVRVLVVTTNNGRLVWPAQFERWGEPGWRVVNHGGVGRSGTLRATPSVEQRVEAAQLAVTAAHAHKQPVAIVVHWQLLASARMRGWLVSVDWDCVIFDESHHAKKPGGVWQRTAWALTRRTKHVQCLTGTLMPNGKIDAFAQTRLLDSAVFGTSVVAHRARYAVMGGFENREIVGWRDSDEHAQRLARVWHVATEDDMDLGLPPVTHLVRECTLGPAAARAYGEMAEDFVARVGDGVVTAANGLVRLLRFAQLTGGYLPILAPCSCGGEVRQCPHCRGTGEIKVGEREVDSAKATLLREVLEEIDPHEQVVVFARFRSHLTLIKAVAGELGREYGEVSGAGSCLTADAKIPKDVRVLGVQIQAGSEAVDLSDARYSIYYSQGYDGGKYEQSLKRTHRPGQTRHTVYVHLLARLPEGESIDHGELAALEAKQNAAAVVFEAMKGG